MTKLWTKQEEARLAELVELGFSSSDIGRTLGRSGSAIIGKCGRLGLNLKVSRAEGFRFRRQPHPFSPLSEPEPKADAERRRRLVAELDARHPPSETGVAVASLRAGQCKFPIGDPRSPEFHLCGKPTQGRGRYCKAHQELCITPWEDVKPLTA